MTARGLTSSQTVGPFFSGALLREDARSRQEFFALAGVAR